MPPAVVVRRDPQGRRQKTSTCCSVDTAGRLQNKVNLMKELEKIDRTIERELATTLRSHLSRRRRHHRPKRPQPGEALQRGRRSVSGIVLTKLDGTAKGGIVLAIRDELGIPISLVGLGEKIADLEPVRRRGTTSTACSPISSTRSERHGATHSTTNCGSTACYDIYGALLTEKQRRVCHPLLSATTIRFPRSRLLSERRAATRSTTRFRIAVGHHGRLRGRPRTSSMTRPPRTISSPPRSSSASEDLAALIGSPTNSTRRSETMAFENLTSEHCR
ncbi:MAG: hypothetical protein MZU97_13630 [Bacillus subtilis]|nr:hypothetical protein [Bacillus subtilis]